MKYCNVQHRIDVKYGINRPCGNLAKYYVTYFADGSGGVGTCGRHLNKAVEDVRAVSTVPANGVIKLLPLGSNRD